MSPPKYPRTPHWYKSQTIHADDRTHNDPSHFVGRKVVITEKLDGGNTCLYQGDVYARSTGQPSHAGWMSMVRKHHAYKTVPYDSIAFYGEDLYGIHSIEYDPMYEADTYRLFATRHLCTIPHIGEDAIHDWDTMEWLAQNLGVLTVPVLFHGVFDSVDSITAWFNDHITEPSVLGGQCEGFVMRISDRFPTKDFSMNVVKYVRPNHVQTDEHWTKNWKSCSIKPDSY